MNGEQWEEGIVCLNIDYFFEGFMGAKTPRFTQSRKGVITQREQRKTL